MTSTLPERGTSGAGDERGRGAPRAGWAARAATAASIDRRVKRTMAIHTVARTLTSADEIGAIPAAGPAL